MNIYPDFSEQGYQVLRELGRNREGGRITWLASNIDNQEVVLKQFCFAQFGSSWSGFQAHQREIEILQGLNHPGIPRYINSFATSDGFCLVQEYINAPSLAQTRSFRPEEIKQIAINALEILVYLQNLHPPLIHRDIKPENILVDEQLNVYLIDFGFARIGGGEVAGSSVFKGTPGFIPPEQIFEPTKATDLYALGTTLICLLTGIKSTEVIKLCDRNNPYLIKFSHFLPKLSLRFVGWLENMVQPEQNKRFANAQAALAALQPLDVMRVPGVDFSETVLQFQANRIREKLTQSITVANTIPDTLLQGRWEVAPHPHDPPHTPDSHAWISVEPAEFNGNHTWCIVQVDTSKLMADKQYKRQLILHSNAYPASHTLTVKVQTASPLLEQPKIPYGLLILMFVTAMIVPILLTIFLNTFASSVVNLLVARLGKEGMLYSLWFFTITVFFCLIIDIYQIRIFNSYSIENEIMIDHLIIISAAMFIALIGGSAIGFVVNSYYVFMIVFTSVIVGSIINIPLYFVVLLIKKLLFNFAGVTYFNINLLTRYFNRNSLTTVLIILISALGASVGTGIITSFLNPFILLALTSTGLPALSMLIYSHGKQRKLIAKYSQSEESLIKP